MKCDEREKNYNLLIGSFNPTGKQQQQQKKDFSTWILETSENVYLFVTLSCLVSFVVCIYMGIAKLFTQLHPAHFSLHPTLGNSLNIIWTKISNAIGQFPQIQAEKFKVLRFDWKLAHMISWRCWFRVQNWIFEILSPKSICRELWAKKVQVDRFARKLAHMVSRGSWFLLRH